MKYCTLIFKLFLIIGLFSCSKEGRIVEKNKFLLKNQIDTSQYKTIDNYVKEGRMSKMTIADYPLYNPCINMERKTAFLQIQSEDPDNFTFVKFNYDGKALDTLTVDKSYNFLDRYLSDDEYYISWFYDGDKQKKKITDINISQTDHIQQKRIAQKLKQKKLHYTISNGYLENEEEIQKPASSEIQSNGPQSLPGIKITERISNPYSFIIFIENNGVYKMNITKYSNADLLGLNVRAGSENTDPRFKNFDGADLSKYVTLDNYYAKRLIKAPPPTFKASFSISVNGGTSKPDRYFGTSFSTLKKYGLKIKRTELRDESNAESTYTLFSVDSDSLINFMLLSDFGERSDFYFLRRQ